MLSDGHDFLAGSIQIAKAMPEKLILISSHNYTVAMLYGYCINSYIRNHTYIYIVSYTYVATYVCNKIFGITEHISFIADWDTSMYIIYS